MHFAEMPQEQGSSSAAEVFALQTPLAKKITALADLLVMSEQVMALGMPQVLLMWRLASVSPHVVFEILAELL
jgi:hypothetical protein